jgi:HD-GYP domain-containing protein (c-di-GMP phosphodiesterase class II)
MSRSLLLAAVATPLVLAAPALAANADAPGAVKKQDTNATLTPTVPQSQSQSQSQQQSQTPQAPAPATTAPAATKAHGNTPVTKGTEKRAARTAPATSTTGGSATVRQAARRRATRRSAPAVSAQRHTSRTGTRRHASTATRSRRAAAQDSSGRAAASGAVAAAALGRAATRPRAKPHGGAPIARVKPTPASHRAPLASLSRAADQVVEVIPGALILALAGLSALVFLLIVRSWTTERRRAQALADSYGITVEALATAIEAKDHTTGGHIERVRRLGLLLASEMAPREARDPQMAYGFLLHDIGKLAVPDAILRAPGRLTDDEWTLMRQHPEEGVRMLAGIPFLGRALDVVRHHHERWDGGGYPAGLRGEEIPLWARIFAVIDALDAMTAERPYRPARSYEAALEEIRLHAGTQFDPAVVEALVRLDPAAVTPLLEPAQLVGSEQAEVIPLAPLVAA